MIAPQKKSAFTLIELIIVITIIGVLAGFLVIDFNGAKRQQELSTLADQALALLQQTQAEVGAGKINEDGNLLCEGAVFEAGESFQMVVAEYLEGECDLMNAELSDYGMGAGGARVEELPEDEFWVLFLPPDGDLNLENDAELTFMHPGNEDRVIYLRIDSTTNKAFLSNEENEE